MKMKNESLICIVVIILIAILEMVTGNYTKESVEYLKSDLYQIKQEIETEDKKKISEKVMNAKENWKDRANKMAYYVEHDELEKVNVYLVGVESNTETEEYNDAKSELEKCIYILEHIEEKYKFNLKNIFQKN